MRREILADGVELYLGDCREILPTLGNVDCVVTSPPYGQQRDYGEKITDWRALVSGALKSVPACAQILCNLGLVYKDGECVEYWQDLITDMRNDDWRLFGWYVWDKGFGMPGNWNGRLAPAHEFVFHFNKMAGTVNKWVRSQERAASGTGLRLPDGSMSGVSSPDKCGQAFKIPDSVIRLPPHQQRGGIENKHPAIFPVNFATFIIKSFCMDGDVVCDPFMGSGTTGVAAVKLGRKFIGIEINETYFDIAIRRIEDALKRPDLFIPAPAPKAKQEQLI